MMFISLGIKKHQIHIGLEREQLLANYKDIRIPVLQAIFSEKLLSWTGMSVLMLSRHSSWRMRITKSPDQVLKKNVRIFNLCFV